MPDLISTPTRVPVPGGTVNVEHGADVFPVHAGQSIVTRAGETVRYSTGEEETEYVAVCTPAFAPELAHREGSS